MKKFVLQQESHTDRSDSYRIPYHEQLNNAQLQAVMHDRGPALVIAGAGTGKTRTLIYRVARLVEDGNPPESILLLTFTRRASREMLERAAGILDQRCVKVKGGTFHSYCNSILHQFAGKLGYDSNFTLLDQADAMDAIHLIRSAFLQNTRLKRFPQRQALQSIFSTAINKQTTLYDVIASDYSQFIDHHDPIEELSKRYSKYKYDNGVMDFDDLLVNTRRLLTTDNEVRQRVATTNRYVMVDEYQDTNTLQAELVGLFSSVHQNLMVVGDDAQSIYAFRGANHKNILSFPDLYNNCTTILLEENYRSSKSILELANSLMEKAREKFNKKLYTTRSGGDLPGLVKAPNERDQSRFVTQMLLHLREQGIPLGDMAVLFRNGRDSYDLEWELNHNNIPFRKFGGQKFAEAAHVRDVLGHLRVIVNPDDRIAWSRILLLLDGIGPKTADELITWLKLNKTSELKNSGMVSDSYKEQIDKLSALLSRLRSLGNEPQKAVEEVVTYYTTVCRKKFDDHSKRIKDLQAFSEMGANFHSLEHILQELTLDPLNASAMETEKTTRDESPLVLSTIHSAKGLEWDSVFIIQCLDGIIPSGYSVENAEALDEELRLLYVAATRARERLFVTYPVTKEGSYGDYFSNPSRFIDEIPENTLEPWLLEEASEKKQITSG